MRAFTFSFSKQTLHIAESDCSDWLIIDINTRDVPDIRFRLAGYPAIFSNPAPVPAKMVPSTGYLSRIVLGPFRQLVNLVHPANGRHIVNTCI